MKLINLLSAWGDTAASNLAFSCVTMILIITEFVASVF